MGLNKSAKTHMQHLFQTVGACMHFWGYIFWKKNILFAYTPKQIPSLTIFSQSIFLKKTQSTRLHALVTPNKGLELVHVIPFHGQSTLLMKENTIKT